MLWKVASGSIHHFMCPCFMSCMHVLHHLQHCALRNFLTNKVKLKSKFLKCDRLFFFFFDWHCMVSKCMTTYSFQNTKYKSFSHSLQTCVQVLSCAVAGIQVLFHRPPSFYGCCFAWAKWCQHTAPVWDISGISPTADPAAVYHAAATWLH